MKPWDSTSWNVVGASVQGTSHQQNDDIPCQDAHGYRVLLNGVIVIAVADGAGSATRSDEGAQRAVKQALDSLERDLAYDAPRIEKKGILQPLRLLLILVLLIVAIGSAVMMYFILTSQPILETFPQDSRFPTVVPTLTPPPRVMPHIAPRPTDTQPATQIARSQLIVRNASSSLPCPRVTPSPCLPQLPVRNFPLLPSRFIKICTDRRVQYNNLRPLAAKQTKIAPLQL